MTTEKLVRDFLLAVVVMITVFGTTTIISDTIVRLTELDKCEESL